MNNLPPGVSETTPNAPWNETEQKVWCPNCGSTNVFFALTEVYNSYKGCWRKEYRHICLECWNKFDIYE